MKFLIVVVSLFVLSACQMDNHAAGEAIFKKTGKCCSQCHKEASKADCNCKKCCDSHHHSSDGDCKH